MTTTISGSEVESATFHVPPGDLEMFDIEPFETTSSRRSGFRGRLDDLKSRGLSKVHDLQRSLGDRRASLKSSAAGKVDRVQTSMKTNPMLWAGVAAGSGFALGMLGRFVHWRKAHRRSAMPDLVIIDATC